MRISVRFLLCFFLLLLPFHLFADSLDDVINDAVEKLKDSGKIETGLPFLINPVVNARSGKQTECSKKVEAKLTIAIMDTFPDAKIISASESLAGASLQDKVIFKPRLNPKEKRLL